jgi:hypothetical protein
MKAREVIDSVNDFVRGFLGLGVTVFVVGTTVMVWNGVVRGWAGKQLVNNPDDINARALLLLN